MFKKYNIMIKEVSVNQKIYELFFEELNCLKKMDLLLLLI